MDVNLHSYEHNKNKLWNRIVLLHFTSLRCKKVPKKSLCWHFFRRCTVQYPPLPVDLTAAFECGVVLGAVEDHHYHQEEHHVGHNQHQDVDVEVQPNGQSAWREIIMIYSFTQGVDGGINSVIPTKAERRKGITAWGGTYTDDDTRSFLRVDKCLSSYGVASLPFSSVKLYARCL